jgi:hypothetical protein
MHLCVVETERFDLDDDVSWERFGDRVVSEDVGGGFPRVGKDD